MSRSVLALAALALFATGPQVAQAQQAQTRVFLNGVPAPVHFNDGDSFRVLGGPLEGTKARLKGFNTLESYGGVHTWGTWTGKELYFLAKKGTMNARQGVWHCTSDLSKDFYGRILWDCPDLAVDQVRKGYAHALNIDEEPSDELLLEPQREAIAAKRGIWAHGVPDYILTSTHSTAEDFGRGKAPYNRLVSSADGHSRQWTHDDNYAECFDVCWGSPDIDADMLKTVAAALLAEGSDYEKDLKGISQEDLEAMITDFILRTGTFDEDIIKDEKVAQALSIDLNEQILAGALGPIREDNRSCMLYVDYRRRYGSRQASCLK